MKINFHKEDSKYWVVYFEDYSLDELDRKEIVKWCYDQFGPGLGRYRVDNSPFTHRWINDIEYNEIRFSEEQDVVLFILRWS